MGIVARALGIAVLLLAFIPAYVGEASPAALRIPAGFQQVIECEGATRISIGNPELLEARPLPGGNEILAVGKKPGETDLVVWDRRGRSSRRIEIIPNGPDPMVEAESLASHFPGIRVARSGSHVLIEGTVGTPEEKGQIESFASSRPGLLSRVRLQPSPSRLLSYDLRIVELGSGAAARIGVRFPDTISAVGSWSGGSQSVLSIGSQFEANLNLLLAEGRARIIANPRIVCESGSTADFVAGGEIPIVSVGPESRSVQWKTYGIILKVSPDLRPDNTVTTRVGVEISTIDHGSGYSEIPAFLTRRMTTAFSSRPGETLMLSGLVKSESAKDIIRLPLLGQIPILGELFKSRSFRENRSELAIFITPSERPADSDSEMRRMEERSARMSESMRWRLVD